MVLLNGNVGSNPLHYSTPSYLYGFPGFSEHATTSDRADGKTDGLWMGHEILTQTYAPAWVHYETDMAEALLRRERYGRNSVPDLFFINYKMTDYAGHEYFMDSPEMGSVLAAQDQALGALLGFFGARDTELRPHPHSRPWARASAFSLHRLAGSAGAVGGRHQCRVQGPCGRIACR
ncbi:MAG: alkaline phosphatase family protein [Actinobacteria bacterium]|nr:alkaline phosphatase family protein [Actinomycetota bacterium]